MATIGIRNNNPGNLRPTGDNWQGQNGQNGGFMVFISMVWGIRAAIKNYKTEVIRNGNNTLIKYITEFAPPFENDTENYISFISSKTGILPNSKLDFSFETVKKILSAQFTFESGYKMNEALFSEAWELATGEKKKQLA